MAVAVGSDSGGDGGGDGGDGGDGDGDGGDGDGGDGGGDGDGTRQTILLEAAENRRKDKGL